MAPLVYMVVDEHRGRLPQRGEELSAHFIADGELKICSKLSCKGFEITEFPFRKFDVPVGSGTYESTLRQSKPNDDIFEIIRATSQVVCSDVNARVFF